MKDKEIITNTRIQQIKLVHYILEAKIETKVKAKIESKSKNKRTKK